MNSDIKLETFKNMVASENSDVLVSSQGLQDFIKLYDKVFTMARELKKDNSRLKLRLDTVARENAELSKATTNKSKDEQIEALQRKILRLEDEALQREINKPLRVSLDLMA